MKDQWYHHAILYSLDVESYKDSNNDGIGDFEGLVSQLDHLSGLGVNCLWLRPFFPSPLFDDGYDIKDYYSIDPRIGNLGDFVDFVAKAKALGMKIIIDLVVNHTSIEHEWFQKSRADKNSKFRNYYIWKDQLDKEDKAQDNMIGDGKIWAYDRKANAYYLHHFLKEQPDLNIANPDVRDEIKKIMGFWLQLGISGFRIDAAHVLVHENKEQIYEMLNEMREFIAMRNNESVLIAEADVDIDKLQDFFGKTNGTKRMHLLFNFFTNKSLFLALVRQTAQPLITVLEKIQPIEGEWVNFLRTHDELNLERLTAKEREEVFKELAPEDKMQIFNRGIRRRLPPMLKGDRKKMELLYSAMFSLPGLPLINYGEEIGMGDDLSEKGRNSLRTVMQWDGTKNAGFSRSASGKLAHPVIDFGEYDYKKVNVSLQQKDPDSLLNWMERMIRTRKYCPQLSFGKWFIISNDLESVLSFYYEWKYDVVLILLNFSGKDCSINLDIEDEKFNDLSEIFSDKIYKNKVDNLRKKIELSAYGYRWFKSTLQ
jgi:maltose alpha-D-glucosyltransferase / alpha-amylase